jgi:hypothetical protein
MAPGFLKSGLDVAWPRRTRDEAEVSVERIAAGEHGSVANRGLQSGLQAGIKGEGVTEP